MWKNFNIFLLKLDRRPRNWEEGAAWYATYLYHRGFQSSTIRSYISGIKATLINDDYEWDQSAVNFNLVIKSCKMINDSVKNRLPVQNRLLETILFELERKYSKQYYLEIMYKAFFMLLFYGMMRIGELAAGNHTLMAKDIHLAEGKQKMKIVLHSSKTHGKNVRPQIIKIQGNVHLSIERNSNQRCYCPYACIYEFLQLRGDYDFPTQHLFIFNDRTSIKPRHIRSLLRELLTNIGLDSKSYDTHSFRIGRATDMFKYGYSVETIKKWGRWRSNAVYKYLRD